MQSATRVKTSPTRRGPPGTPRYMSRSFPCRDGDMDREGGGGSPPRTKALEVAGVASAVCSGINVAVQREPVGLALRVVIGGAHRLACLVGHLSGARRIGRPRDRRSRVLSVACGGYR